MLAFWEFLLKEDLESTPSTGWSLPTHGRSNTIGKRKNPLKVSGYIIFNIRYNHKMLVFWEFLFENKDYQYTKTQIKIFFLVFSTIIY